jgi:hypothetical protein
MTIRRRHLALAALGGAFALRCAAAIERGRSDAGVPYVSGGVSQEELQALRAERAKFSFWLTTAAARSGAHLADVEVRITRADSGELVLEHQMQGPWLFADLPPGGYRIEAAFRILADVPPEVQRGDTTIHRGDHRQMVLYFGTGDEVGDENPPAIPGKAHDRAKK